MEGHIHVRPLNPINCGATSHAQVGGVQGGSPSTKISSSNGVLPFSLDSTQIFSLFLSLSLFSPFFCVLSDSLTSFGSPHRTNTPHEKSKAFYIPCGARRKKAKTVIFIDYWLCLYLHVVRLRLFFPLPFFFSCPNCRSRLFGAPPVVSLSSYRRDSQGLNSASDEHTESKEKEKEKENTQYLVIKVSIKLISISQCAVSLLLRIFGFISFLFFSFFSYFGKFSGIFFFGFRSLPVCPVPCQFFFSFSFLRFYFFSVSSVNSVCTPQGLSTLSARLSAPGRRASKSAAGCSNSPASSWRAPRPHGTTRAQGQRTQTSSLLDPLKQRGRRPPFLLLPSAHYFTLHFIIYFTVCSCVFCFVYIYIYFGRRPPSLQTILFFDLLTALSVPHSLWGRRPTEDTEKKIYERVVALIAFYSFISRESDNFKRKQQHKQPEKEIFHSGEKEEDQEKTF
eukprot:gene5703-4066_t